MLFRPADWYDEQRVEALTRVSATKLDLEARRAQLSNRETVTFDKALLATGANVRRLHGARAASSAGIHYLRTLANSDAIREDAAGKRVVLIGGSYIACEVAASLTELGSSCTLVMLEPVVLSRGFGEQAGPVLPGPARGARDRGARRGRARALRGRRWARHEGGHRRRGASSTPTRSSSAPASNPDVMLARAAGLALGESGGVVADSRLETQVPGVYVAGDIAEYDSVVNRRRLRVEHWDVAFNMGKTVALNMLGRDQPHDVVPYFFSDLSDWASLEYVGPAAQWDAEVVRGSIDDGRVQRLVPGRRAGRGGALGRPLG